MQPKVYLACSPDSPLALRALFYVERGRDLFGWYLAAGGTQVSHAFFMLENFYANASPVLYRSLEDDVYQAWTVVVPPGHTELRCPVPEELHHELERLQSQFIDEWLFFSDDPESHAECAAYRDQGLALQAANIKSRRLPRLANEDGSRTHQSAGCDRNVAEFLEKAWRGELRSARVAI